MSYNAMRGVISDLSYRSLAMSYKPSHRIQCVKTMMLMVTVGHDLALFILLALTDNDGDNGDDVD